MESEQEEDDGERDAVLAPRRHFAQKVLKVDLSVPETTHRGAPARRKRRRENLYEALARQARRKRRLPEIRDALPPDINEDEEEVVRDRNGANASREELASDSAESASDIQDQTAGFPETRKWAPKQQFPRKLHPLFAELIARRRPAGGRRKCDKDLRSPVQPAIIKDVPPETPSGLKAEEAKQEKMALTLHAQHERMQRRAKVAARQVDDAVEVGKDMLPLNFLMRYKLETYCQQRGSRRIVEIMQQMLLRAQLSAFSQWVSFIKHRRREEVFEAAVRMQRVARGFLCRRRGEVRRRGASREKGMAERERLVVLRQHARVRAGVLIQSTWRLHVAKALRRQLKRDLGAVVRVQTHWRGKRSRVAFVVLQRLRVRQIEAATRIQSAFRGMRGRRAARFREVQVRHERREAQMSDVAFLRAQRFAQNGAALTIQRVWRRKQFRSGVVFIGHRIAVHMQCIVRGFLARRLAARRRELCGYEQWVARHKDAVQEAAIQVQVMYRARLAGRELERLKDAKNDALQQRLAAKAGKVKARNHRRRVAKLFVSKAARTQAACTIQKFWRGRLARRLVIHHRRRVLRERKHRAATLLQSLWRMHPFRVAHVAWRRNRAATRIQAAVRGHAVRALGQQRQHRADLATRIEAWWRMNSARAELATRRRLYLAQLRIAGIVRCYAARSSVRLRLDEARAQQESALRGALEAAQGIRNEQSRLALAALHCNPARTAPEDSEPLGIYYELVDPGRGPAGKSSSTASSSAGPSASSMASRSSATSRTSGSQKAEPATLGSAAFAKFCQSIAVLEQDRLSATDVDILFSKCCMGKRKMDYLAFVDALELIAEQIFPEVVTFRAHRDNDAQIARFLDEFVLRGKWRKAIRARTNARAGLMAVRIQGMYRTWKSRQRARLARVARDYQILLATQTKAVLRIQGSWRLHAARQRVFKIMRGLYRCFIDTETNARFWQNPTSGLTTWQKPALLGEGDVDAIIHIPPARHQIIMLCDRCEEKAVSAHCEDCEIAYCQSCTDKVHSKGKRAQHDVVAVSRCSLCKFQMATKSCLECGDLPLCDCCADYSHRKGNKLRHELDWLVPEDSGVCQTCGTRAARFDQPYPTCSTCVEHEYGLDSTTLIPRRFTTRAIEEHRQHLHETRVRAFVLEQAQQKEELRLEKERHRAAAKIQACARRALVRRSAAGIRVHDAILARRERIARAREDAERKKLVNRFKANLTHVQRAARLIKQGKEEHPELETKSDNDSDGQEKANSMEQMLSKDEHGGSVVSNEDVPSEVQASGEVGASEKDAATTRSRFGAFRKKKDQKQHESKEAVARAVEEKDASIDPESIAANGSDASPAPKKASRFSLGRRSRRGTQKKANKFEAPAAQAGASLDGASLASKDSAGGGVSTLIPENVPSDGAEEVQSDRSRSEGVQEAAPGTSEPARLGAKGLPDVKVSRSSDIEGKGSRSIDPKGASDSKTSESEEVIAPEAASEGKGAFNQNTLGPCAPSAITSDLTASNTKASELSTAHGASEDFTETGKAAINSGVQHAAYDNREPAVDTYSGAEAEEDPWEEYFDESQQAAYYYNRHTGETVWKDEYDAQYGGNASAEMAVSPVEETLHSAGGDSEAWDEFFDETHQAVYFCHRQSGVVMWKDEYERREAQEAYAQDGYAQEGYFHEGYAQEGYAQEGYAQEGYAQEGYAQEGYAQEGYAQEGYAQEGYAQNYVEGAYVEGNTNDAHDGQQDYAQGYWDEDGTWHDNAYGNEGAYDRQNY